MHVALQNNFHLVTTEFWQCLQNWGKLLVNALLEVGQCHMLLDSGSPEEYPFMAFLSMGNRKMYGGSRSYTIWWMIKENHMVFCKEIEHVNRNVWGAQSWRRFSVQLNTTMNGVTIVVSQISNKTWLKPLTVLKSD